MKINHLGIATKGIEEALRFWEDALGLENVHTETVEDQKVRVAMLPLGESRIELLEPTSEDSPISKFLEKRGGGIHHIAVEVEDYMEKGSDESEAEPHPQCSECHSDGRGRAAPRPA